MAQTKRGGRSEATRLADLLQQAADDGANTAEEIHKAVADLPLEVLAKLDIFKETAKDVRRVQDASIGAIYDVVHRVNREVAKLRGSWLGGRLAERPPQPARPAGPRRGAPPPRRRFPQRRGWGASCTAPRSVAAKRRRAGSTATIISAADVPPAGGRP